MASAPGPQVYVPGQPSPTPFGMDEDMPFLAISYAEFEDRRDNILRTLEGTSLLGLLVVSILGILGAYWLAGQGLRPLTKASRAARAIGASSLSRRIPVGTAKDEVREMTLAFNSVLDRVQSAYLKQSEFVSNAAHELRTPLATMRINVEVTKADPAATLRDYEAMSEVVERAVTRLERLVSQLLIMATNEKSLANDDVPLKSLLEAVLQDLTPLAEQHKVGMCLSGKPGVTARGDRELLRQVFSNLVENAIRYNHTGGSVKVDLLPGSSGAQVVVTDTGVGIPKGAHEDIFERFQRIDSSRSRHSGGAGLGLAIAAHIVQLHNGSITVKSSPGEGSRFTVTLPT